MISLYYTSHTKAYNTIYTACNIVEAIYSFTDTTKVTTDMTNRKLHMCFRLAPRMTLNCYKFKFSQNFALLRIFGRHKP